MTVEQLEETGIQIEPEKKQTILIIDDENSNIIALNAILQPEFAVLAAKNGKAGLNAAKKHVPDIILLDIIMPEIDGFEIITELKKSEKTKNIPVIFISGLTNPEDEEKGLRLGAADYISKPFSPAIVKLRIKNQIKILNQMRLILKLSMTDRLTGLPNRRFFEGRLKAEWWRSKRENTPISILMVDVDNFKSYNDTYGHQQGDHALCAVADAFTKALKRSGDFTARWGGEEFIMLLPNTNLTGALEVAEQLRAYIEAVEIPCACDNSSTGVTISIGVNTKPDDREISIEEFIGGADKALYAAKADGRNRVLSYKE